MNTHIIKNIFILAMLSLMFVACDKVVTYNDGYDNGLTSTGAPTISKISKIVNRDSVIVEGNLDQMIIIQGSNLSGVQSIVFNDVTTDLKTAYVRSKEIVVPIPRIIPSSITNKLVITTALGKVTYDFKVSIPPVAVTGLYNEFVAAGDTAIINGQNFDLYQIDTISGKVSLGGTPLKIVKSTANMLRVAIPVGSTPDSKISISSPKVTTPIDVLWQHGGLVMLDYNNLSNNGIWSGANMVTDGTQTADPKPLIAGVKFTRIVLNTGAWSWNVPFGGGLNINDADILANPANYNFKFEINTKSSSPLAIGNIMFQLNGGNFQWNPGKDISFNTYDKWATVSFNLLDICNKTQNPILASGWNGFVVVYQPTANLNCDFSISNFRIVHK